MYLYKDMSFILSHMHQSHRYNSPNGVSGKNEPTMLFVFWGTQGLSKTGAGGCTFLGFGIFGPRCTRSQIWDLGFGIWYFRIAPILARSRTCFDSPTGTPVLSR